MTKTLTKTPATGITLGKYSVLATELPKEFIQHLDSDFKDYFTGERTDLYLYDGYDMEAVKVGNAFPLTKEHCIAPLVFKYNDYCGSDYEKSNSRVFLEKYKVFDLIEERSIGYGGTEIYLPMELLHDCWKAFKRRFDGKREYKIDELKIELLEDLKRLCDYGVLDEDDHWQLEMEGEGNVWRNYMEYEFPKVLAQVLPTAHWNPMHELSDSQLQDIFWQSFREFNGEFSHEQVGSYYCDPKSFLMGRQAYTEGEGWNYTQPSKGKKRKLRHIVRDVLKQPLEAC